MRHSTLTAVLGSVLALAAPGSPAPLAAQSIWTDRGLDRAVWIEVLKPAFKGEPEGFSAASVTAGLRWPVGRGVHIVLEVPYARFRQESGYASYAESSQGFGNPYLGFQYEIPGEGTAIEVGFRPAMANRDLEDAALVGALADFDRFEAFSPEVATLALSVHHRARLGADGYLRIGAGPAIFLPQGGGDNETCLSYGAQAGFDDRRLGVAATFTGRFWVNARGSDTDFGSRTLHQLAFSATAHFGILHPAFLVRLPLDEDLKEVLSNVVGVSVGVTFPQ